MDDLISVIVPVYNVGKYFRPCLESIRAQSYKNIEAFSAEAIRANLKYTDESRFAYFFEKNLDKIRFFSQKHLTMN